MINYTYNKFVLDVKKIVDWIKRSNKSYSGIYPVLSGGSVLAVKLSEGLRLPVITKIGKNILVVDDIVDSGRTRQEFMDNDFVSLHVKKNTPENLYPTFFCNVADDWVHYWWEKEGSNIEDNIVRVIEYIGDNPRRKGLIETPMRVRRSFDELYEGYKQKPEDIFKTFDDEEDGDEVIKFGGLVYLRKIEFYSMCEHHLLPFSGNALVAYIPDGPVIGTSKMARLVDLYSRRLQMQERIGEQVTNALMKYLKPIGAACLTEAKHLCIACRGVKKQHSIMGYHSLKGTFLDGSWVGIAARQELMTIWNKE